MGAIELDNDRLAAGSERVIEKIDLPKTNGDQRPTEMASATLSQWLREKEKQFLAQKLEDCGGNVSLTARSCGIGLRSLYRKMQKYELDKKRFKHSLTPKNGSRQKATARELPKPSNPIPEV
jgi:DNA-binding NtrC family response regulator